MLDLGRAEPLVAASFGGGMRGAPMKKGLGI